jgi:Beta-lactamase
VTGEPYNLWIAREIIAAADLAETAPDTPIEGGLRASGHGLKAPLGRRPVFPFETPTDALSPATGFVSTAAELACFFGRLSPTATQRVLSAESRREMTRPQWPAPYEGQDRKYGLGIMSGELEGCSWFGHIGVFPGYVTRTAVVPQWEVAVSIVANANDGPANPWVDGALRIMSRFAAAGPPTGAVADWTGRWWSLWGAVDLVPVGDKVLIAQPALLAPFAGAGEITVSDRLSGRVTAANGFGNFGERARRVSEASGRVTSVQLGGLEFKLDSDLASELEQRHPRSR